MHIPRVVQIGALRLTTQPVVMQADMRVRAEFWQGWDQIMRDDRFAYVEEPAGMTSSWRSLCAALPKGTTAETDTYLAAFALAGGTTLATFDKGFARFAGIPIEIPR